MVPIHVSSGPFVISLSANFPTVQSFFRGAEVILLAIWNSPTILRTQPSPDLGLQGSSWSDSAPRIHLLPLYSHHQPPGSPKFPGLFFASQPLPDTIVTQTFTWFHSTLYLWLGSNFMCSVTSSYLRPQPRCLSSFLLTFTLNCIVLSSYFYYISPTRMQSSCVQTVCIIHNWNSWCPQRYQI